MATAPLVPSDLLKLVTLGDPQLSPNGSRLAWVERRVDAETDRYISSLYSWAIDNDGGPRVVAEQSSLTRPRWSPDGRRLAFVGSSLTGRPALWLAGADERSVGSRLLLEKPPLEIDWHPTGDYIAMTARVAQVPDASLPIGVLRTGRLRWKEDGGELVGDQWRSLLLVNANDTARSSALVLVGGTVDAFSPSFSPDGRQLAFLCACDERQRRRAICLLDVSEVVRGPAEPRVLTEFADVRTGELTWSPDGSTIAVAAHDRDDIGHYGAQLLWLVDAKTGARSLLTGDADGTIGNATTSDVGGHGSTAPQWHEDGQSLVAPLSFGGHVRLVRFWLDGRRHVLTPEGRVVIGFHLRGNRVGVLTQGRQDPAGIEVFDLGPEGRSQPVARLAKPLPAPSIPPQPLRVRGDSEADAPALDGWLMFPTHPHVEDERLPLVLFMGGGPGGMRSDNYTFVFQLLAQSGYAVLWVNTRGCQGYGDRFCTSILGRWGTHDFDDAVRALDAALAIHADLDPNRVAIVGGSYGGYQVNWALGHTNRFRAAIADRSVCNRVSSYGTSDIGFLREFEFDDRPPWEEPQAYLRQSPLGYLAGATTPTLVVHSALDRRCPVEQGEQLFMALRSQGVATEFLRFPNESHDLARDGRPWHRVFRLEAYLEWLDRWLAPSAASVDAGKALW